jgi:hypothetical protein
MTRRGMSGPRATGGWGRGSLLLCLSPPLLLPLCCSGFGVQQPPGHGTDLIEEVEGDIDSLAVYSTGGDKQSEVGIDLLGRGVSNAPVVEPIST